MKRTNVVWKVIGLGIVFACQTATRAVAIETLSSQGGSAEPSTDAAGEGLAQVQSPSERFPQPLPELEPLPPGSNEPTRPQPSTPGQPPAGLPSEVLVQDIQVMGSTVFDEADFAPILANYEGRSLTPVQLGEVADAITQLYAEAGYITSRAVLGEQVVANGTVTIQVIEGGIESILVEGNEHVRDAYVRNRVALGARTPFNQLHLEEQLRLLQLDPLFETVEASIQAGTETGQSILTVRVNETNPLIGGLSLDNYSPDSVGSVRVGAEIGYLSPFGLGDKVFASTHISTTGGSQVYELGYKVPLNAMDGTLQFRFIPSNFRITDDDASFGLDITGSSDVYEVNFRQPLIRSLREELALSLGFRRRDGQTLIFGQQIDSSITSVFQIGQDYLRRDLRGAWGVRSQFNIGTGLFGVTERAGDLPDGTFFSWLGQVQRVQILNENQTLVIQGDLQLAADALLGSDQFILGGGQSLRGYRQNVLFGDSGFRFSVEDRITLDRNDAGEPNLQVAPFLDLGTVWSATNVSASSNEDFLAGIGTGILWEPLPGLDLRLDVALPLVNATNQERNFFFSINYRP